MSELLEVTIDSLRVSLTNQQRIVVLKVVDQERYLPIWIGPYEAEAITIALQEIEVARPQTHDLLKTLLQKLDGKLQKVIISALKDDIFYATLFIEAKGKSIEMDSRPSDAIALALRAHVPILVTSEILEEAAIEPEKEEEMEQEISSSNGSESSSEEHSLRKANLDDRLSVFDEYLKKRGKPKKSKLDDSDQPDESEDSPEPEK